MAEPEIIADTLADEGVYVFPASFAQERLWLLANLEPGSPAYNCHRSLRLTGPLRLDLLGRALRLVVDRHETLRTCFATEGDETVQVVHVSCPLALPVVDLSQLPAKTRDRESLWLARREANRPFDLRSAPLLRVFALRLAAEDTVLLLTQHHITTDGWSMNILVREVSELYKAFVQGRPAHLPELPIQYADFAAWQRERCAGPWMAEHLAFWRRYLDGVPRVLELPTDHPRHPDLDEDEGLAMPRTRRSADQSRAFLGLVQSQGATAFMGLFAAFQALILRWTGEEEFLVGTPVSGRDLVETEDLIGFFVNTLALRARPRPEMNFRELLAQVRADVLDALAHQEVPFTQVVEAARSDHGWNQSSLFQVVFALQQDRERASLSPETELALLPSRVNAAKFDLSMITVAADHLDFWLAYRSQLFDPPTMARLVERYEELVAQVAADPDLPLGSLDLLAEAERHQLLIEWNDSAVEYPRERSLAEIFTAEAARWPERTAVVWRDRALTFRELDRLSGQLASRLRQLGVGPEVPVALYLDRTLQVVVGLLGILKAGGFYVPLDLSSPAQRLADMLDDSTAAVILTDPRLAGELPDTALPKVFLDDSLSLLDGEPVHAFPPPGGALATAYVMYTSGSTGRPKGVRVPHQAVVRLVKQDAFANLGEDEVFLQAAPISFDAATLEIWAPLLNGGRLVLYGESELTLDGLERAVREHSVTTLWLTAGLFHQVVEERVEILRGSLRQLLAGGDVLLPARVEKVLRESPGVRLINGYGPTENTTFSCCHRVTEPPPAGSTVPIGRPIANTRVYVLDRWLQPVPAGSFGELHTGGDGLAISYFDRAALTAERFVPHPFAVTPGERLYRTGDRVRWQPGGTIEFAGRIDNQIKLRGYRIELGEIEALLSRHEAVREAAVVVREGRLGDRRLVAFVVSAAGGQPEGELPAYLRRLLPAYMVPALFIFVPELPKSPNGKVDRRALSALRGEPGQPSALELPRTATEQVMAEIWAEVLGIEQVGRDVSFFDLGGHSLLAMQVVSRVRKIFAAELPLRSLFEHDTVGALAAHVEKIRQSELGIQLPPITPAPRIAPLPLSFAQQRLWLLDQLAPGSSAYNVPAAWRLSGRLRFASLAASLTELVRRHESLRTTFHLSGEGPSQVIAPPAPVSLPVVDLRRLPAAQREPEARRLAQREAWRPFDLARGPLLRTLLVQLEDEETLVLATLHHIVSDGWSFGVFGREITALEAAYASSQPSPLPELPIQYADFAVWQRKVLAGGALEAEIRYWREQLRDAPQIADLPLDRPRSMARTDAGAVRAARLSPDLAAALKRLGRRHGATLFVTLLAGFQALLARYARKLDVSVGTPIAGRNHIEVEGLIGFFVNTLVLRVRMEDDPSFEDLVKRVRSTTLDAYTHQNLPFEELVEKLQPERNVSFSPLFQVMFVVQSPVGGGSGLEGLEVRTADVESRTAKFDLALSVAEAGGGLDLHLGYSTDLFDGTTAARLLGHLERLLAAAVADPGLRVAELPLLSEAERATLPEWNDSRRPYPRERCLHELFEEQARRAPERVALVWRGEAVSYGELDARANRLAHYLCALGVGAETRVGMMLERSLEMIVAILGILKAGGAYVPLDPAYPDERLALMMDDAGVAVVLAGAGASPVVHASAATLVDLAQEQERIAGASAAAPSPVVVPDNLAYVLYTSGSTGRPKGVSLVHRNAVRLMQAVVWASLGPDVSFLQLASVSFDASTLEIWGALLHGGRLVLYPEPRLSIDELAGILASGEVNSLFLTAGLFHQMVEERPQSLASLRQLLTGGDAISPRHAWRCREEARGVSLVNCYGPTENGTVTTFFPIPDLAAVPASTPVGRPISNSFAYILDAHLQPLPIGVAGELYAGGDGVARGYLDQPALTAARFLPSPFDEPGGRLYRTGDLARHLPDGTLEFLGRSDNQVKLRGFRIEPGEIEAALAEYPLVRDAIVIAREDAPGDRRLVAYVVPEEGSAPTPNELRGFLQELLPEHMIPAAFLVLEAFPLTPHGKVDRRALPEPERDRSQSSAPYVAPRTAVEEVLALIWAELLKVERVGVQDNFFELGGHSLLATQVVSRVRGILQTEIPLRAVFERPTLGGLAHVIESVRRGQGGLQMPPLERADRSLALPLSFAQQRLWFIDQLEPGSPVYNVPLGVRLRRGLHVPALERSLAEVVHRHEVLRTSYASVEGQPVQVIAETVDLRLAVVDLEGLAAPLQDSELRSLARWEAGRPFDLASGPVLRTLLLRLSADDHVLLTTVHHIACDAWSTDILLRELTALYLAFHEGRPSPLVPLPVQYADYAAWQRRWLEGEALEAQVGYWKSRLGSDPPTLELPTDRPRPAVQSFRGRQQPLSLSGAGLEGLRALARREGATPFMTLLAVFQVLLRRYSGQYDISVGTPVTGRNRVEVEGLIGFFLNTLVIRVDLPGEVSFLDLLRRVRTLTLEAYAYQDLPFEKLVDELRPQRSLSHSPLFQAMFVLLHQPSGEQPQTEQEVTSFHPDPRTAKFDLTWAATVAADGISGLIEYNTDLFDCTTVQRIGEHLRNLVESAGAEPDSVLSALTMLGATERHQLLAEWNDSGGPLSPGRGVQELFERQAERTPETPAVVFEGRQLSYRELDRRANQVARALRALGAGPEARVALGVGRSLETAIGLLGILKAGAAYVPIDPTYPRERRRLMLLDAQAAVLVTQESLRDPLCDKGLQVLCLDSDSPTLAGQSSQGFDSGVCDADLAYVIFTSGSTGRPKGVALPHAALRNLIEWHLATLVGGARTLQFASLSFDASFHEMFGCWGSGGTLFLLGEELRHNLGVLADYLVAERIEKAILPVVVLHQLAEEYARRESTPPLIEITTTGEQLQTSRAMADLFRRLPGCAFHNHYGPSESHVATAYTLSADPQLWTSHPPIGSPIANSRIHLLDATLAPVPLGVPGELYIGGVCLARGYLGRPDLTAERFVPDPFGEPGDRLYRTGDKVRRLGDGNLDFIGRFDHQVKVRGFRVELEEVESVLASHPAVRQNVVLAREDVPGDRRLVAYLVVDAAGGGDWRSFLLERLPEYMVPSHFVVLGSLPLTPNGKVDHRALPAPEVLRSALRAPYVGPLKPVEEVLASIWADVLGLERVGTADDFFELGGHSLTATRVLSRLRQTFKVELALRELFEAPTVGALAQRVEKALRAGEGLRVPAIVPVARDRALSLSFGQERLWFLDQLQPASAAYHLPVALRIHGRLSPEALRQSLEGVVQRHEVLRTVFAADGGDPVQVIEPPDRWALPVVDLSGLSEDRREPLARSLAGWEAGRPFDLARGPLLRALLVRLAEQDHLALVTMHHVVSDGWSMGILVREVEAFYGALTTGERSPLPPLPVQYADYASWQRGWLQGETLEREIGFWRQQLAGAPRLLELPTDRPRPAVQSMRGAVRALRLAAGLPERLKVLSRLHGTTPFMTLLAGFQALLARHTGQRDILVGTPVAGRNSQELEGLIGFFVNTLVLRMDLVGEPGFRELLERVRETTLIAYAHQELPFEKLVEEVSPERSLAHSPLFQVMFVLQNAPTEELKVEGLRMEAFATPTTTAKFDLTLALAERGGELSGAVEYNIDLFDAATIDRLAGHFATLLCGAVADPARRFSELPLLPASERHQLLCEWNDTATGEPAASPRCLHELFAERARQQPGALAVLTRDAAGRVGAGLTYGEVDRQSDRLACHLIACGVGPDVCVGLCLEPSLPLLPAILGIWKAGGAYLPLAPDLPRQRLAQLAGSVPLVLTRERWRDRLPQGTVVIALDSLADLDGDRVPGNRATPANLAYVLYTSGSTGVPKGIMVSHAGLLHYLGWAVVFYGAGEGAGAPVCSPLGFDLTVTSLFAPLLVGCCVELWPEAEGVEALRGALTGACDYSFVKLTPAHLEVLRQDPAGWELRARARVLIVGGEALHGESLGRWRELSPRTRVINEYGPAETVVGCCVYELPAGTPVPGPVPIGRPIRDMRAFVLDEAAELLPAGVAGELYLAGNGLARGYRDLPERTAERFLPDPFATTAGQRLYRTGDLVRLLPDGRLVFLGRLDHQVKVRGFRIELGEIEAALAAHDQVQEAVVLLAAGPVDQHLAAYVVPAAGTDLAQLSLRAFVGERLPEYMVPSRFVALESLPLTPNGKVDRRALAALDREERRGGSSTGPRDVLELRLLQIWQDVLAAPSVGVEDDFFVLGGHSMLAVRLMAAIERELGRRLPVTTLFQARTVESLARVLRRQEGAAAAGSLVAIRSTGERRPMFWVHPGGGGVLCYFHLARHLGADQPFYALRARGLDGEAPPLAEVPALAAAYVEELLAVQPEGPYWLGGWSLGGVIAFEMARQLRQSGQELAHLVLLDTHLPHPGFHPDRMGVRGVLAALALQIGVDPGELAAAQEEVGELTAAEQLQPLLEQAHRSGGVPADLTLTDLRHLHAVFVSNLRAVAAYEPQLLDGRVHLCQASEGGAGVDPALWRPLARRGVEVIAVEGNHYSLLREPHVALLAQRLREETPAQGRSARR